MGLIWIKETNPREKLYLEELGLHAETLEELSYLILKYPPLFLDNFVGEKFFSFLSRGARHRENSGVYSAKRQRAMKFCLAFSRGAAMRAPGSKACLPRA